MTNPAIRGGSRREIRVDFFRGLAMFFIFIPHISANPWAQYTPARFGPSDAAEIFVFCSGFAAALALGTVFTKKGFWLGTARILYRTWQLYWAHIGLFLITAALVVFGSQLIGAKDYVGELNLHPFFDDPARGVVHLLTLTYVPNYFDILPMYIGCLLMIPLIMALSRVHPVLAMGFSLVLWTVNLAVGLQLPAEWWSDRPWFFNPFAWQLIFFTGFGFGSGWLRPPAPNRYLIGLALVFVILMFPMKFDPIWKNDEWIRGLSYSLLWGFEKTDFAVLRFLHFLCLAYLALCLLKGREQILHTAVFRAIRKVGEQALAVFVTSMAAAQLAGMALDLLGRRPFDYLAVHVLGFGFLIAVAYGVSYFKSAPWRPQSTPPHPAAVQPIAPASPHLVEVSGGSVTVVPEPTPLVAAVGGDLRQSG